MIIAWPSWVMWLFVIWMVVNIGWIVYQFGTRKNLVSNLLFAQIKSTMLVAQLHAQLSAMSARLASKDFGEAVGEASVNTGPGLSQKHVDEIKKMGGEVL